MSSSLEKTGTKVLHFVQVFRVKDNIYSHLCSLQHKEGACNCPDSKRNFQNSTIRENWLRLRDLRKFFKKYSEKYKIWNLRYINLWCTRNLRCAYNYYILSYTDLWRQVSSKTHYLNIRFSLFWVKYIRFWCLFKICIKINSIVKRFKYEMHKSSSVHFHQKLSHWCAYTCILSYFV